MSSAQLRSRSLILLSTALLLAACGSGAPTAPPAQPSAAAASSSAPASATPSESADAEPSGDASASPTGDASASPGGGPDESPAQPSADVELSDAERQLVEDLRPNANRNCAPRDDVPSGATAGVECEIASDPVERVGVYGFADADAALAYYIERLEEEGVELDSGACGSGEPGDAGDEGGAEPDPSNTPNRSRVGCFVDEFGQANTRVLCGDGRYIGVLGRDDDIAALHEWTVEQDESAGGETGGPAGICLGPADGS